MTYSGPVGPAVLPGCEPCEPENGQVARCNTLPPCVALGRACDLVNQMDAASILRDRRVEVVQPGFGRSGMSAQLPMHEVDVLGLLFHELFGDLPDPRILGGCD